MSNISFGRTTLGSEVIPGPDAKYVYSAMNNMDKAIHAVCLVATRVTSTCFNRNPRKILLSISSNFLQWMYETFPATHDVVGFLSRTNAPPMVNLYLCLCFRRKSHFLRLCKIEREATYFGREFGVLQSLWCNGWCICGTREDQCHINTDVQTPAGLPIFTNLFLQSA